ncbi:MAG: hypothetical protein ACOCRO_08830 [Halanaerobiales bacterium]
MTKKLIIIFALLIILSSCSNMENVEDANPNQPPPEDSNEFEKIKAETPLPEKFPIVEGAVLVDYFDFYGMYQYTYATDKDGQDLVDILLISLKDIGIMATCHSSSQFAEPPSKDIVMVDGSEKGGIGYIIVHPEGASKYGDVPGYTVIASENLLDYEPIEIEEISIEIPGSVPIYPEAILVDYQDNSEEFIPTFNYTFFVYIDCFDSMDETELMLPEIREICDYYLEYFRENGFDYDIYPHEIDAFKRNDHIVVTITTYDISGVVVGGKIEIEMEQ